MTYQQLLQHVRSSEFNADVRSDTRLLNKGDIFVAISGVSVDGHDYIPTAIAKGACWVVCKNPGDNTSDNIITVADTSQALGQLSQAVNGDPAAKLTNLAVTGTNGKTSVCYITRSIIQAAGHKCGLISTIVYDSAAGSETAQTASLTTPDSTIIAKLMKQMVSAGATYMATEASSHALSQNRLAGVPFAAAAFTNLTGDHLDYHNTLDQYLAEKTKLFSGLSPESMAVLNLQSPQAQLIAPETKATIMWYAVDEPADLSAKILSISTGGTEYELSFDCQTRIVKTSLVGKYNISNQLAAAGMCLAVGIDLDAVVKGIADLASVPGRLEPVKSDADFSVLIDYAHTDDALKNVLATVKPLCANKLTVVFGCGGDRDKTKRPRMAAEAEKFADRIIVTSDNPRTEPPARIIDDILEGFSDKQADNIHVEPDRKKAIELAIESAAKDDIIVIAGKGHETYQLIGEKKFDFDDKLIALEILNTNDSSDG